MQPWMGEICESESMVAPASNNQVISSSTADLLASSSNNQVILASSADLLSTSLPRSASSSVLSSSACNFRDKSHEVMSSDEAGELELQGLLLYLKHHFSGTG